MSKYFLIIIVTQLLISCTGDEKNYHAYDIELWKDTEVWDFANCISKGNFEKAESILNQEKIPIDFKDPKFGETLLCWAIWNNNLDAVKFLVSHGANPNAHDTYNGQSPMSVAASEYNSVDILKYLLENGGSPNDYVKENEVLSHGQYLETPLTSAAYFSIEKTKLLVEAGADVNFAIKPGQTSFYKAAISTRMGILEYLLFNSKMDYKKTYIVTIDNDTLYLKEILERKRVIHPEDSIIVKHIYDYIDTIITE